MRRKYLENEKNKTTFIKEAQKTLKIKVALFLWFCDFWVLKYQSEKSWLWGRGAPPDLNQKTWDQVRRGHFDHIYDPWNLHLNFSNFMCPSDHDKTFSMKRVSEKLLYTAHHPGCQVGIGKTPIFGDFVFLWNLSNFQMPTALSKTKIGIIKWLYILWIWPEKYFSAQKSQNFLPFIY